MQNDTGQIGSMYFDEWFSGYGTPNANLNYVDCPDTVQVFNAFTTELLNTNFHFGYHLETTGGIIMLGGRYININVGNNGYEFGFDSTCARLDSVTIDGITYNDVIHCLADSATYHIWPEVYYGKNVGLIYLREYGSTVAWHKM